MITELFSKVMSRYPHARDCEAFKGNSLGNVVRNKIPIALRNSNTLCDTYIVKGSVGQGGWAAIPWIAIMDSRITTTTQNGIYIVYLFSEDGSAVYLTLNQGCTELIKQVGRGSACDNLSHTSDDLRRKLIIPNNFLTNNDFIIGNKFYESGCIAYKRYKRDSVPLDKILLTDLSALCTVYEDYYALLNNSNMGALNMNICQECGTDIEAEYIGRLLDFAHPERYMGCDPVQCVVEGEIIEGRTWRDILIALLEKFLTEERGAVRELYRNNLLIGSKRPMLLKEKPEGSCRQLSNGYWVYMNFNIPVLVELIGRLCEKCGVAISDVHITYQNKAGKGAPMITKTSDNSQTYKKIVETIRNDYTNGFVFSSTSLRLLSDKIECECTEKMQEQLKQLLFKRNDEVYFIIDVIASKDIRDAILSQAKYALDKIGYLEINALYEKNKNNLHTGIIRGLADFEDFYSFLYGENVRCVGKHGFRIARLRGKSIDELFGAVADKAYEIAHNEYGGVITIDDLFDAFPLCSAQLIDYILRTYSEMLVRTEINDVMCFQTIDALGLTEDFSEQLAETLDNMDALEIPPSDSILHAILSTKMNVNFKIEYGIPDDKVFRRLISLYYKANPSREWKAGLFTEVND